MKSESLADDYLERAEKRIFALEALMKVKAWADVVRESQECVELALKGLMKKKKLEVPRVHDVSEALNIHSQKFPKSVQKNIGEFSKISRDLRRDRELAFYGSEDLEPSTFYKKADADKAIKSAKWIVESLRSAWPELS